VREEYTHTHTHAIFQTNVACIFIAIIARKRVVLGRDLEGVV
jgi:hypothetical protein